MEAHSGMSARIAEEAGFKGLWGSGLAISASNAVRDANEQSDYDQDNCDASTGLASLDCIVRSRQRRQI